MFLYHLRLVPWLDSQLLYHALPRVDRSAPPGRGIEGLFILAPAEPYVCIGYHQDAEQEVDLAYCREHQIPVFRREVGGGAVFLDGNQVFYQLVLHKDNPLASGDKPAFYARMLQPVADAYRDLGVPARFRPVNDIVTEDGRKISGNGAATIEDYVILVGNLIADFDYDTMVRVLRVPDEKFRDKVFKTMRENLTTLKRETGRLPAWDEMASALIHNFEKVLGPLHEAALPKSVYERADSLKQQFLSEEWLLKKGRTTSSRDIKIAQGLSVVQRVYKAPGGLLRATLELREDRLEDVSLSGDFFCYPESAIARMETALNGVALSQVRQVLSDFYADTGTETPGVTVDDWLKVLVP